MSNQDSKITKREFLRFAGASVLAGIVDRFLIPPALAGTWTKVGTATGTAGTWQKITATVVPVILKANVATGWSRTVALRSDGLVFACGYNDSGQLGDDSVMNRSTFVQAIGISNAVAVAGCR